MIHRWLSAACFFVLAAPCTLAAPPAVAKPGFDPVKEGEFPGIALMPPGSKPKGIDLQRYDNHRLAVLLNLQSLEVLDRSHVLAQKIDAELYGAKGDRTTIHAENAVYSFLDDTVRSVARASLENTSFRAEGTGVTVQTKKRRGFLLGPVKMRIAPPKHSHASPRQVPAGSAPGVTPALDASEAPQP